MPTPTATPFKMSMYPASVTLHRTGDYAYAGKVTVIDSGKVALNVKMQGVSLGSAGHACGTPGHAPAWLHLAPASFQLQPGQSKVVGYTVSAHAGTTGSSAVIASGTPVTRAAGPHLAGALGSRVTLGTDKCNLYHVAAPVVHHGGSSPVGVIVVLALLALVVTSLIIVGRKIARSRRAAR